MSKSQLHQKTSLIAFLSFLLVSVCFPHCAKQTRNPSLFSPPKISIPKGSLGSFRVEFFETHLLLHGFIDPVTKTNIPLLFDTGSEVTFLAKENHPQPKSLVWNNHTTLFPVRNGILPEGMEGVLGHDFFQHTCIWWEGDILTVYEGHSSVCQSPEAYFSTSLKLLVTERINSFYYVRSLYKDKAFWSLVDTGATLSFLPPDFEEDASSLGSRKVLLAGGSIREVALFYTKGPLTFQTRHGNTISYFDFSFLRGISLEHLQFKGEKDREAVWVIGLNLLNRAPLFWDFERIRIGVYSQTQEIH